MEHNFNVEIAKLYGVNVAIFLNNLLFWVHKNRANKQNFRDGNYWTYNTVEAYTEIFPYWSYDQIRTIIKKCIRMKN